MAVMTIGLVGRKVGMMRIFTDEGDAQPVTVLDVSDNRITQIKTADKDGYSAVQVAFGKRRANRVRKPLAGHLAKAAVEAGHTLREFRADAKAVDGLKVGGKIGVVKRHHFSSNRETHGNSITTRTQGSTGQRQDPGRVFPGKRMAGHLGNATRTTQNLTVVRIDAERQLLLVSGSVPGFSGRDVVVRPAVKGQKKAAVAPKPAAEAKGAAKPAAKPAAKA
jgi:large subunit ribosomal protein L3